MIVRLDDSGGEWLAVVREWGGTLTLPKGGIEAGEDALMTLRREVHEESGLTELSVLTELGTWERENEAGTRWVQNRFFFCTTTQTRGSAAGTRLHAKMACVRCAARPLLARSTGRAGAGKLVENFTFSLTSP